MKSGYSSVYVFLGKTINQNLNFPFIVKNIGSLIHKFEGGVKNA